MNAEEFDLWCETQHFANRKVAARALGVSQSVFLRLETDERARAHLTLACLLFDNLSDSRTSSQASQHYTSLQRRLGQVFGRERDARVESLETALILGVSAVIEVERGMTARLNFLRQTDPLISRRQKWRSLGAVRHQASLAMSTILTSPSWELGDHADQSSQSRAAHDVSLSWRRCRLNHHGDGAGRGALPAGLDLSWTIRRTCDALVPALAQSQGIFLVTAETRSIFPDHIARALRTNGHIVAFDRRRMRSPFDMLQALTAEIENYRASAGPARGIHPRSTALDKTPTMLIDAADLWHDMALLQLPSMLDARGNEELRIILVARPSLQHRLNTAPLHAVQERLRFETKLFPLSMDDNRSVLARSLPSDFALGHTSRRRRAAVADYVRSYPEETDAMWRRARRIAEDSGSTTPSLAYAATAVGRLDAERQSSATEASAASRISVLTPRASLGFALGRYSKIAACAAAIILGVLWTGNEPVDDLDIAAPTVAQLDLEPSKPLGNLTAATAPGSEPDPHASQPQVLAAIKDVPTASAPAPARRLAHPAHQAAPKIAVKLPQTVPDAPLGKIAPPSVPAVAAVAAVAAADAGGW